MKVSLSWLSDYIDIAPLKEDLNGVLEKLTLRGLEVEQILDLSKGFEKVIVAQIETRDKHPNADRLSVCKVNTGSETLQIVCGAQNMKAGDKVALSMIGAELPNGLKIQKGKIRDIESFGMLCSETELGLSKESEGIIILGKDAPLGKNLAQYLGREDIVFELNVTPNRGDALSMLGVAREIAAILGQKVKYPEIKKSKMASEPASKKIKVSVEGTKDLCYQYHGRYLENVKVGATPEWMKKRLESVGLRSINNVVDITNFVLYEMGTPLHAFDFKNVDGGHIRVRMAAEGEKIPLLDETEVTLTTSDLVISDAKKAVALAGVMGGGNSEVTEKTTAILLEAAQFDPSTVRKSAKRHQKKTDSSHRFERQIDFMAVSRASERAAALICELTGATLHEGVVSVYSPLGETLKNESGKISISIDIQKLNKFIGTNIFDANKIRGLLEQIGFEVASESEQFAKIIVPSFRPDVRITADVFEEILRMWGFDQVEAKVPQLHFIPERKSAVDVRAEKILDIKTTLMNLGYSEVMNYAFISEKWNETWGSSQKENTKCIQLVNPLNEEMTTLKTSLLTGLVQNLATAINHQIGDVCIFEVRPTYFADDKSSTGVREEWMLALLTTGAAFTDKFKSMDRELDFYDLKGDFETILESAGCRGVRYEELGDKNTDNRFHPGQSARILLGRGACGVIGRMHPQFESKHKFRTPVYMLEVSLDRILELSKSEKKYVAISKFPKVPRDLSLIVPEGCSADRVLQTVNKHGKPLIESVQIVDLYRGDKITKGSFSLSIAMVLSDANRTLEEKTVDETMKKILSGLEKDLSVTLRLQ